MNKVSLLCLVVAAAAWAHIKPGSFSVQNGMVYTPGQIVTLAWTASIDHNMSNYDLWYSADSGKTWTTVKSGIPGKAANVLVTYAWTVPSQPTTKGMLRVFQVFGGTVATNPSSPGDYTLFSPVFEIKSTSAVSGPAHSVGMDALRLRGDRVEIRIAATQAGAASLEILNLDGSIERSLDLPTVRAGDYRFELGLSQLGSRKRSSILLLRVDGKIAAEAVFAPFH